MKKFSILVTSAGVSSAINIIKSLNLQREFNVTTVGVDVDPLAAGLLLTNHCEISPSAAQKECYIDFLLKICKKYHVNAIFPCYSGELHLLAENKEIFHENGVEMLLSTPDAISLCNNKIKSIKIVDTLGIPVPKIIDSPTRDDLPLFSKPIESSSSKGTYLVDDGHLLEYLLEKNGQRIYQEFIQGKEYTLDVLCNKKSEILFCGPRIRIATKSGQSVKGVTVNNSTLQEYASRICNKFGIIGPCNIQFMEQNGDYYFIEINPRYAAGGLMLSVFAGTNLPFIALKLMFDLPIFEYEIAHRPNIAMTRYWEELFIEGYNEN